MSGQCGFNWMTATTSSKKYLTSGPDDTFFKVRADDRNLYILRRNTSRDEWTLESFRRLND